MGFKYVHAQNTINTLWNTDNFFLLVIRYFCCVHKHNSASQFMTYGVKEEQNVVNKTLFAVTTDEMVFGGKFFCLSMNFY